MYSTLCLVLSTEIFFKNCKACRFWILAHSAYFFKAKFNSTSEYFYDNDTIIKGKILRVIAGINDTGKLISSAKLFCHRELVKQK